VRRKTRSSSIIIAIFLLIGLAMIAGPNFIPRFVTNFIPTLYEAVPCEWLRRAENRAEHQSLLGRSAANPVGLRVQAGPLPTDAASSLFIRIVVTNNSLGTIAFVYNPLQVTVGDNGSSGLGLLFTPANSLDTGAVRQQANSFPESDLRLLGPRQSCVHVVEFPAGNVLVDPTVTSGSQQVRAFYRNNTRGQVVPTAGQIATPIFNDQGLWTGYVESDPVVISVSTQ
jgi:hypothetical protein